MLGPPNNLFTGRAGAYIAVVFGLACMFVYPAIPIGNTVGVDITLGMTLVLLLLHPSLFFGPSLPFMLLMMVPFLQSTLASLASGGVIAPEMLPKHTAQFFLSVVPFVVAYELLRAGRFREILIGVSLAMPVHALIGMYQMWAFDQGYLPFLDLMATNPGMSIPSEMSENYADFTRRPFGLFAEPSAMAACVGPWLVLSAGVAANTARSAALRVPRALLLVALLSGCFLLAVSESGQAPFVLAGLALALLSSLGRKGEGSARPWASWAAVALMLGAVVTTAVEYASRFGQAGFEAGAKTMALEARSDSSWDRRLNSFLFVWDALSYDVKTFLFGVGPG